MNRNELEEAQQFWANVQDALADIAGQASKHLPDGARSADAALTDAVQWANTNAGAVAAQLRRAGQQGTVQTSRASYSDMVAAASKIGLDQLKQMSVRDLASKIDCGKTLASVVRNNLLAAHMASRQEYIAACHYWDCVHNNVDPRRRTRPQIAKELGINVTAVSRGFKWAEDGSVPDPNGEA